MRNMMQGTVRQLAPLVWEMEHLNSNGCNYSLDIIVVMDCATVHYYDIRIVGTQVLGTRMTVPDDDVAWAVAGCSGAEWASEDKDVSIAVDMIVEFEHYMHVLDGIRCNFHKVSAEKEQDYYDFHCP